jgi:N-acetylglucosamine-6-phosphate deacetylase
MITIFENGTICTPLEMIDDGVVTVDDSGKLSYVGSKAGALTAQGRRIDLAGRILSPGFIDIHTHGGFGITFGDGADLKADLVHYARSIKGFGVTGFLMSVVQGTPEEEEAMIVEYAGMLPGFDEGAEVIGLHLEGPFLCREKKGAFNPNWLREPTIEEMERYLKAAKGWAKQMTIAPEFAHSAEVAAMMQEAGCVAALGHSNTSYEVAADALRGDFTHVTHTYNAQRGFNHREPGVVGAILASDKVTAELIPDTIHVHPGAMITLVRCLGTDRVVAITDAMAAAGFGDGDYELVGKPVSVKDGKATQADGTIAGGASTLNVCVDNLHKLVGVTLPEAIKMASLNPAKVIGEDKRIGSIEAGKDANLIVIDEDVNVYLTMVKGKAIFEK